MSILSNTLKFFVKPANDNRAPSQTLSAAFNPPANSPFIFGRLERISDAEAVKMHARFKVRIASVADTALPEGANDDLKEAAREFCVALSRTRNDLSAKAVAEAAAGGPKGLIEKTRELLHDLDKLDAELKVKLEETPEISRFNKFIAGLKNALNQKEEEKSLPEIFKDFDNSERIYFRLRNQSQSPVKPLVEAHLGKLGYTVTDYTEGYAQDSRRNIRKIGKLLKDSPGLMEAFREDPSRLGDDLMVVLTRSCGDLARASYGRGWQSCRSDSYSAVYNATREIEAGVIAAYLVRGDDPDIHDPLGRINLKPYDRRTADGETETVYLAFNPIGLHHPGFVDAVNRFADDHINGEKYGRFSLRPDCESFLEFNARTRLPRDARAALDQLKVKYKVRKSGAGENEDLVVDGNLDLSGLGLNRLPDLTNVVVKGDVNVSGNKLLTLEGLPQAPVKNLNASGNLLVCFAGASARADETFDYRENPYLVSTYGAPEASNYRYGNKTLNHQRGTECVGPLERPECFPGFKRNSQKNKPFAAG